MFFLVTGTIVRETLYSENGSTPRGERTTTNYSSDPKDFNSSKKSPTEIREKLFDRENSRNKNLKSITRTEMISGSGGEIESVNFFLFLFLVFFFLKYLFCNLM